MNTVRVRAAPAGPRYGLLILLALALSACAPLTLQEQTDMRRQWAAARTRGVLHVRQTGLCARYPSGEVICE